MADEACSSSFHVALFAKVLLDDLLLSVPCKRSFNAVAKRPTRQDIQTNTAEPNPYSYTHKFPSWPKDVTDDLVLSEGHSPVSASTALCVGYTA